MSAFDFSGRSSTELKNKVIYHYGISVYTLAMKVSSFSYFCSDDLKPVDTVSII